MDVKMFFGTQALRLRNSPSRAESDVRISVKSQIIYFT